MPTRKDFATEAARRHHVEIKSTKNIKIVPFLSLKNGFIPMLC